MGLRKFFAVPAEQKHRNRVIHAVFLCFVLYGYRAIQVEMLRLDADLFAFFAFRVRDGIALIGVFYWFVLLFLGIRAIWSRQPNGLLVSALIIGALFAFFLPEPPMREEIKFFFNRDRYEEVVAQVGKTKHLELSYEDMDLAYKNPIPKDNFVQFNIYPGNLSLVYSGDKTKPEVPDCMFNADVWKKIDENWYICRRLSD